MRPRERIALAPRLERWLVVPARHHQVLATLLGAQQVERDEACHAGHAAGVALERLLQVAAVLGRHPQAVDRDEHRSLSFTCRCEIVRKTDAGRCNVISDRSASAAAQTCAPEPCHLVRGLWLPGPSSSAPAAAPEDPGAG